MSKKLPKREPSLQKRFDGLDDWIQDQIDELETNLGRRLTHQDYESVTETDPFIVSEPLYWEVLARLNYPAGLEGKSEHSLTAKQEQTGEKHEILFSYEGVEKGLPPNFWYKFDPTPTDKRRMRVRWYQDGFLSVHDSWAAPPLRSFKVKTDHPCATQADWDKPH